MDKTLGLLDSGGSRGVEKDYMGLSSKAPSSYSHEAEIELGLGLSLSGGGGGGGAGKGKGGASAWGEFGRILTAQDLPNGLSVRAAAPGGTVSSGTKRAAEFVSQVENEPSSAGVSQVVGWPPIGAYRMNSLVTQSKVPNIEEEEAKGVGEIEKKNSNKKINYQNHGNDDDTKEKAQVGFIKVNVDGLAIGRKIDMNAHASYESLAQALLEMFFTSSPTIESSSREKEHPRKPPRLLDESSEFVLTYEDKEGDWMLVGDVPWGMFLCTVKRLRIMRSSEANGLACPRLSALIPQKKHERQKGKKPGRIAGALAIE